MVVVEVNRISKQYGNKIALYPINLAVKSGEIIGLLGPNGAGKSTLMNIMTGYLSATDGCVLLDGQDIMEHHTSIKKKIGYLPEHAPLYLEMTVHQYLSFMYDLKQVKSSDGKQHHLNKISEQVHISDVSHRLIKNLSKGYRQRIGFAQALLGDPEVLFLDEPSVGLDPPQRIEMRRLIKEMGQQSIVFSSSHILSEIESVCDRIVMINQGKMILDTQTDMLDCSSTHPLLVQIEGDPQGVINALLALPFVIHCVLESRSQGDRLATYQISLQDGDLIRMKREIFFALAEKRLPILDIRKKRTSLEETFASLLHGGAAPNSEEGGHKQDDDDL